jgi:hypothetical protein
MWGTDVKVADAGSFAIPGLSGQFWPSPRLAVDTSGGPDTGALYVVWTKDGGSDGPDVVLSKSTDHGASWSAPVPASDTSVHSQFAPCVAVDPNGSVVVGFYDGRDDADNRRVNFYVSRSSDGGQTFQKNVKVSDADFDVTAIGSWSEIVLGNGVAASDRMVHAIWTDGRNGDADVYTGTAALDFFTDVTSIPASTGGTANFTLSAGPRHGDAEYHVLGSTSGTAPGIDFYFENVPVNFDLFTLATVVEADDATFPGFTGFLDSNGSATASLVSGPLPQELVGVQMDFAMLVRVGSAVVWSSSPTHLEIGN